MSASSTRSISKWICITSICALIVISCKEDNPKTDLRIKDFDTTKALQFAKTIDTTIKPELAEGLTLILFPIEQKKQFNGSQ